MQTIPNELKEKIIIRMIKKYKNREDWNTEYVETNFSDAIEYLKLNFDKYFEQAQLNTGGRIQSEKQGSREVTYMNMTQSGTWKDDSIILSVLGSPCMRLF